MYLDDLGQRIFSIAEPGRTMTSEEALLYRLYAALLLAHGERVSREDVHDAWAAWRGGEGVVHPSLVPFADLAPHVQALDQPYVDAIRAVAREMGK